MLLKQNDKHLTANINHLAYSMTQFAALIEQTGMKADFDYASGYLQQLKQQVYPGPPIVITEFSIEKDYTFVMTDELKAKIDEHSARINEYQEWKVSDGDLIHQYAKNFADFKNLMNKFIAWHVKVIQDGTGQQVFNEQFELDMGINVQEKKLTATSQQ